MSISFTAACIIGNFTSLGPLPTQTITPPGFVQYIPVHKLNIQKSFYSLIDFTWTEVLFIIWQDLYFYTRSFWDLEAATQHSIVESARIDLVKSLHIFLDISFSAFPTYSDFSFSNSWPFEFTSGVSIRYVPLAPRVLAIFKEEMLHLSFH